MAEKSKSKNAPPGGHSRQASSDLPRSDQGAEKKESGAQKDMVARDINGNDQDQEDLFRRPLPPRTPTPRTKRLKVCGVSGGRRGQPWFSSSSSATKGGRHRRLVAVAAKEKDVNVAAEKDAEEIEEEEKGSSSGPANGGQSGPSRYWSDQITFSCPFCDCAYQRVSVLEEHIDNYH